MSNKGEIYKLYVDECDDIYIGSTSMGLQQRLIHHTLITNHCNSKILNGKGELKIELLETVYYDDINELRKRERHFIENTNCINRIIPTRTPKEYYQDNKELRKQKSKEYYYKKGKERNKDKIICECGNEYIRRNKNIHLKTKKHLSYINNIVCPSS